MSSKIQSGSEPLSKLLSEADPPAVKTFNPKGAARYVLICEHARRTVPQVLGDLGLAERHLQRHISWDIGAAGKPAGLPKP